jgi:Co/Zn/Cd efflux system component
MAAGEDTPFRRAVTWVAALNLGYFGIEFAVATAIGSVALFADSVDFLEDTALNLLALLALGWSVRARARVAVLLALILLVPSLAALWTAWQKILDPVAPAHLPLILAALGALVVNPLAAFLLAPHRAAGGSLATAVFYSARNDAAANGAIILAGLVTAFWPSAWPDLVVGLGIAALNAGSAREVWKAARQESQVARS